MNENIQLINDPRKWGKIFNSLMTVKFHLRHEKTQQELLSELKEHEKAGKLRIYVPEEK